MTTTIDKKISKNGGLVGNLILVVAGLVLLSYFFDIDVIDFIKSPPVQNVWNYIKDGTYIIWDKFLDTPVLFIWNKIIIGFIWEYILKAAFIIKDWIDLNKALS